MDKKKAVLLINVGTPDQPTVPAVRKFLFQFLNDRKVIDLPLIPQKILVNLIIVPFRAPKSTKLYERLWTENGSPIIAYTDQLVLKLNASNSGYDFYYAMRYGNPSLFSTMQEINQKQYDELIVLPMYPQFADSTTGTTIEKVKQIASKLKLKSSLTFIDQFYNHPAYLKAQAELIRSYDLEKYDHVVFSYHGLPIRHLDKSHPEIKASACTCEVAMPAHGKFCYKATCFETSRLLAKELALTSEDYTISFQSRLSDKWMKPFTDDVFKSLALKGKKKILVATPSFVTDCLETIVEIGFEGNEIFIENGGTKLEQSNCLNDTNDWANAIIEIINEKGA